MKRTDWSMCTALFLAQACGDASDVESRDEQVPSDAESVGDDDSEDGEPESPRGLEIKPGVGIGPVELGGTYGALVDAYGEPDSVVDYYRIFFVTWLALGVEVVVASAEDDAPQLESEIVSVGTRLVDGFTGIVVPGMSRVDADAALGPCYDIIDDIHCYHSAGVYLGYAANEVIQTVAVHPAYTTRPEPPELLPALGLGGVQ